MKAALFFLLAVIFAFPAGAERREDGRYHEEGRRHEERWHGDIRQFRNRDLPRWRAGKWHHEFHDGRLGWWWVVGTIWYFYPRPVYPYPDPYAPQVILPPAPPQYWYYCSSSGAYYPYVPVCPEGWRMIPAAPPR
jgi:hypothetical protein